MTKILVVEDEKHTADTIALYLEQHGYECYKAYDGQDGISYLLEHSVDLIVLDWMLPGLSGIEICRIAKLISKAKVIILSARSSISDKVMGLDTGADDYLSKPFSLRELYARIRMLLREQYGTDQPVNHREIKLELGNGVLSLHKSEFSARFNEQEIPLTATEFRILNLLAERGNQVVTKEDIAAELYGSDGAVNEHTITVHLSNMRTKLRQMTGSTVIKTMYGVGYKLGAVNEK
ncbi:response regulator transcription factor [Alicyclobacillus sp. ALC3]|uniref:response regulator transcription factor n=1 Tax=Alicyclobacillus sp. ALC3 TaxID=2796143 RepID=UPI002378535F|nr:response regulator transcription factor [Alicyclobacillus sp. ALC3]WDL96074.1 response regulator transcription factor [Alicyclobacillus sp. ALC3]